MASARRAPTEQQASCRGPLAAPQSLPWEVGVDHIGRAPPTIRGRPSAGVELQQTQGEAI